MRDYGGLDPALAPLHQHVAALVDLDVGDDVTVERIDAEMPIELDVLAAADTGGDVEVQLGSSPPLYYQRTGFRSAPHHIRVSIVPEHTLVSHDQEAQP